jgi:hypothetical protein
MRIAASFVAVCVACGTLAAQQSKPSDNAISPSEAAEQVGKRVTMRMVVKSTGELGDHLLHSNPPGKKNKARDITVKIPQTALKAFKEVNIDNPSVFYREKTIEVFGHVTKEPKRARPIIIVTDPKNIKVVAD